MVKRPLWLPWFATSLTVTTLQATLYCWKDQLREEGAWASSHCLKTISPTKGRLSLSVFNKSFLKRISAFVSIKRIYVQLWQQKQKWQCFFIGFIYAKSQSISKEQIFRNSWNISFRVGDRDYCNDPQLATITKKLEYSCLFSIVWHQKIIKN